MTLPISLPWLTEKSSSQRKTAESILDECMDSEIVWKPQIGMEFNNIDDAWNFWSACGANVGFGVRKQWHNKCKKEGEITSCRFVCCKEGVPKKDKRDHLSVAFCFSLFYDLCLPLCMCFTQSRRLITCVFSEVTGDEYSFRSGFGERQLIK